MNIVLMLLLWVAEKFVEKALDKLLEKILSDRNFKHLTTAFKLQILVLYLDWLLQKTSFQEPPDGEGE
ncbi:hypothetical protein [Coleofasciculus sp. H7-2]|uniref:hypothetical protein n=1 Tax=Coleofasciculus sp. H7-2 TaxID=3351545 RepID=UPI00366F0373